MFLGRIVCIIAASAVLQFAPAAPHKVRAATSDALPSTDHHISRSMTWFSSVRQKTGCSGVPIGNGDVGVCSGEHR